MRHLALKNKYNKTRKKLNKTEMPLRVLRPISPAYSFRHHLILIPSELETKKKKKLKRTVQLLGPLWHNKIFKIYIQTYIHTYTSFCVNRKLVANMATISMSYFNLNLFNNILIYVQSFKRGLWHKCQYLF